MIEDLVSMLSPRKFWIAALSTLSGIAALILVIPQGWELGAKLLIIWLFAFAVAGFLIAIRANVFKTFRRRETAYASLAVAIALVLSTASVFSWKYCLDAAFPVEIVFHANDPTHRFEEVDGCINNGIRQFRVAIHNKGRHTIEKLEARLTVKGTALTRLPLEPNPGNEADLLGEKERLDPTFTLAPSTQQVVNVVLSDPMHPEQSFVAHTANATPRNLPEGECILEICVSANNLPALVCKTFHTAYDSKTRVLEFWDTARARPPVLRKSYGAFLKRDVRSPVGSFMPVADKSLRVEVGWVNAGGKRINSACPLSRLLVLKTEGLTDRQTDNKFRERFEVPRLALRDQYCSDERTGRDLRPGETSETEIVESPVLQASDIDEWIKGTTKIYLMSWLVWKESENGPLDSSFQCSLLRPPVSLEAPTWQPANRYRYWPIKQ